MSLADYQPSRMEIPLKGGSVSVRGLSTDDFAALINAHLGDVDSIFDLYDKGIDSGSQVEQTVQFAIKLVSEAPALAAHIIALACDEPDSIGNARMLPLPVQINVLKAIGTLTFEEAGGFRKFQESLTSLIRGIAPSLNQTGSLT